MEAELNATMETLNNNDSDTDMHEIIAKILVYAVQPSIGLAIILTNIALLIFYRHKAHSKDVTFLLLTNLTVSDILLGVVLLMKFIFVIAAPQYLTEACRVISGVGGPLSCTMSVWCIFLIFYQVSQ